MCRGPGSGARIFRWGECTWSSSRPKPISSDSRPRIAVHGKSTTGMDPPLPPSDRAVPIFWGTPCVIPPFAVLRRKRCNFQTGTFHGGIAAENWVMLPLEMRIGRGARPREPLRNAAKLRLGSWPTPPATEGNLGAGLGQTMTVLGPAPWYPPQMPLMIRGWAAPTGAHSGRATPVRLDRSGQAQASASFVVAVNEAQPHPIAPPASGDRGARVVDKNRCNLHASLAHRCRSAQMRGAAR